MKKLLVTDVIIKNLGDSLEGSIDEAIGLLTSYKEIDGYTDLTIELDYSGWSDAIPLQLKGRRPETDSEYEKRLAINKKEKEQAKKVKEKRKQEILKEAKKLGLKVIE